MSSTRRRLAPLAFLAPLALLAACGGGQEKEPTERPVAHVYPDDPEATAHALAGERLFAQAESSPDPRATYGRALREFSAAAARVPSPGHRFREVRTRLLAQDPDAKDPAAPDPARALDAILAEAPDHAPSLALRAMLEANDSDPVAAADRVERACTIAALATDRAVRVFVADQAAAVATLLQRKDAARAVALMTRASDLGSPCALMNVARLEWIGRGVAAADRTKAIELARAAADARFTLEEIGRGLLVAEETIARLSGRIAGDMLVQEGRFDEARVVLARGVARDDDASLPGGEPNPQFYSALAELAALETLGLGGPRELESARRHLQPGAAKGHPPSLELLGRIAAESGDGARAKELFLEAARGGSLGALAAAGEWDKLAIEARDRSTRARPGPDKLYDLRTALFALAISKGAAAREEAEEAARREAEGAPANEPSARQLRHVAGDLSADDLQATMPKAALLARWRAETELALATRCLLLGDKTKAREHLQACRDAHALTQIEAELAWAGLRALE